MSETMEDALWHKIRQSGFLGSRRQEVHFFETVDSTNTLALSMSKEGAATGTIVVAETQTMGRGRLGKTWSSPAGTGLYCTIILRPNIPLTQLARVTLAAGLAVAQAIDEVSGLFSMIKWPNDVLLGGKKVAGILAECDLTGGLGPAVALGVGINLGTSPDQFPSEVRTRATSLSIVCGRTIGKGLMLSVLVDCVEREIERVEHGGFARILSDWKRRDATAKQLLSWLTTDGQTICGQSLGPDNEGCLIIRDKAGRCHQVMSGDITLDPSTLNDYFP
ncbi:MAG: biotin--[acetyl-CoA-carboxylase] ligase [Proteobacteria bacterium]|nr:biotin--[acetyl-CoA-carboxylase] ligase [Desulfobulbaceae bacterium]MBU4154144.1 biotin--[acetyl-CoA-carboxylase] ligase [Pseudomonadota bacterium]MDP2106044.1 biotin--[acetyl-CoA-carboxylase] ligase [Desulfobulbaceae bacterium]